MFISMSRKSLVTLTLAVVVMTFAMAGCGSDPTETPVPTAVPTAAPAIPTVEPVPAEAGEPTATTIADTYIRTGPGTGYPAYAIAPAGKSGKVLGKNGDGTWYVVELPTQYVAAGYGWVFSGNVTVSNIPADLPVYPSNPPASEIPVEPITAGRSWGHLSCLRHRPDRHGRPCYRQER
jgi:uncharacterized protein YraI